MRRLSIVPVILCATAHFCQAQTIGVGSGPYPTAIQQSFATAFQGTFQGLVELPPETTVEPLGSPGLAQYFKWAANTSLTAALVDPDPSNTNITLQIYADIYTLYGNVGGVSVAGYPTNNTTACPANSYGTCDYQLFTKDYALFVYSSLSGSYFVSDPFFTEWTNGGGISGPLGVATSGTVSVTSEAGTAGTQQLFAGGAIYSYTASSGAVSTYTVSGASYSAFAGAGGVGYLGFPTTEAVLLASGQYQQTFQNGTILWTPGGTANVLFPIAAIEIDNVSSSLTLNAGATATLIATVVDTRGNIVTGRTLSWSTSNGNAVTVQANGYSATIKAVGAGFASIEATGGGIVSPPINVTVIGQCCAIGAGAPTQTISQAFQAAAARNNLSVLLPNPTPVVQNGPGYIQILTAANGSGTTYVIAESSQSAIAYVIGGALYAAYLSNGGFSGPLGYPASDASAGGTQSFTIGAALAGSPVTLVPVPIAANWIASGAETGPLGEPAGGATTFTSLSGINGNQQSFANGTIFGITSGSRSGQGYVSSGLILARYLALSGPAGLLGTPLTGIFTSGAALRENFETGWIDLQPGAAAAVEHYNPLTPSVTAVPATVAPGGKVHVAISGFAFGSGLQVSVTGESGFIVTAPGGEFSWDIVVPATAKAATVTIQATTGLASETASGTYTIAPIAALHPVLTVLSGDQQTGAPGATLASQLIAALADSSGNPLPGVPVSYSVSPGASAIVSGVTDANGQISATLRLQPSTGIALLSVSAGAQTVTFSAISAAKTISGFPAFTETSPQGGLTAALAAVVSFYQNSGALGTPNGAATPASLGQYLTAKGGYSDSETGTAAANPWIATQFAGLAGGVSIESPTVPHALDLLNAGSPLVLELNVSVDGAAAGSATVDAIGINADSSIAIMDPNSALGQTSLSNYLSGFSAQGHAIQASLAGVIRIVPALTAPVGFVSAAIASSGQTAGSPAGACTNLIEIPDAAVAGQPAPVKVGAVTFLECDGTQPVYQLGFGKQTGASVLDLAGGPTLQIAPGSAVAWQVTRVNGTLTIAPQTMVITSVVNAAGFGAGLAPEEIISIFGAGFTAGPAVPTVSVNGEPAQVLAAFPFQVNAIIPAAIAPGSVALAVSGPLGTATQNVTLLYAAPGIFVVANQDGTTNGASNPAARGSYVSIYGTGLGSTPAPSVAIGNLLLPKTSYAGAAPGFAGLFQINVQIPAGAIPGSAIPVSVTEAGQTSNTVSIAIE